MEDQCVDPVVVSEARSPVMVEARDAAPVQPLQHRRHSLSEGRQRKHKRKAVSMPHHGLRVEAGADQREGRLHLYKGPATRGDYQVGP